jgi:hypothetical protein
MTATDERDLAVQLVGADPDRALLTARRVEDPWVACRALAWVARCSPEDQFEDVIDESLRIGKKTDDPHKVVASAAWPIRAMIERDHCDRLLSIFPGLLNYAEKTELLVSRSEALFLVFQAIFPAVRDKWFDVLQALISASVPLISWRQKRNLRDAILIVRNEDEGTPQDLTNAVTDCRLKRRIERATANSERQLPRPFFW